MKRLKRKKRTRLFPATRGSGFREASDLITVAQRLQASTTEEQNRQSVCFTGHRHMLASDVSAVIERLDALLDMCYDHGYRYFLCGGALGFDTLAGERVAALQARCPDVRLIMVLPCGDQAQRWPASAIERYERLLYAADEIRVLAPSYYQGCMQVRNRYMVDHSSLCVCYWRHQKGGTASTVAYALKRRLPVLNVAMEDVCAAFPNA